MAKLHVNCDLGHCLFYGQISIKFLWAGGEKMCLFWPRRGQKIYLLSSRWPENRLKPLFIKTKCSKSKFIYFEFTSEDNLRVAWIIFTFLDTGLFLDQNSKYKGLAKVKLCKFVQFSFRKSNFVLKVNILSQFPLANL